MIVSLCFAVMMKKLTEYVSDTRRAAWRPERSGGRSRIYVNKRVARAR